MSSTTNKLDSFIQAIRQKRKSATAALYDKGATTRLEKPSDAFKKEMTPKALKTLAHHAKVFTCNSSTVGEELQRGHLQGGYDIRGHLYLGCLLDLK